jgi:uncharacterized protein (UPF0276 family)
MVGLSYFGSKHAQLISHISSFSDLRKGSPLEVLSDPVTSSRGIDRDALIELSKDHPIYLQGKALSVGSTDPLDMNYLACLKQLARELNVKGVGDFLAWTGVAGRHIHALMPVVYNSTMLKHLTERVHFVQDFLGMRLSLENTLVPVNLKSNEMSEPEFFGKLCDATGCGVALNLPNIFLNSRFQNFDAEQRLSEFDTSSISSIKLYSMNERRSYPFTVGKEEWDRSIWSLLSLFLRKSQMNENSFPIIFVRDDDGVNPDVSAYLKWVKLMAKELENGPEKSARADAPLSL